MKDKSNSKDEPDSILKALNRIDHTLTWILVALAMITMASFSRH